MSQFIFLTDPDSVNPDLYPNISNFSKFGSKKLTWGNKAGEKKPSSFHLLDRVTWYGEDKGENGHEPTFNSYKNPEDQGLIAGLVEGLFGSTKGLSHRGSDLVDFSLRGGFATNMNRREIDAKRINQFLYNSTQGSEFRLRQAALQLLNPQENTRTWNNGASLLAQIMAMGTVANFKRHGAIPEPAGANINAKVGDALGDLIGDNPIGDFVTNAVGGDYVSMIGDKAREINYGLGDPSKTGTQGVMESIKNFFDGDPDTDARGARKTGKYNVSLANSPGVDKINALDIFSAGDNGAIPEEFKNYDKDFVPFRFEVIDLDNPLSSNYIVFRAFISDFSDMFSTKHNTVTYSGRGEEFYTYNNFNRKINFNFKIAAQSRHEMKPLYKKLNYLAAQSAPNYSTTGRMRTPYMKLTIGDYFYRLPGVLTSIGIKWDKSYPFEIKLDNEMDKEMLILPQILDVSISYQPIHTFTPNNSMEAPFISIDGRNGEGTNAPNWLKSIPPVDTNVGTVSINEEEMRRLNGLPPLTAGASGAGGGIFT
tara:strand:+ start:3052 stop:4662 length:1611 start_codon:yes stop_codon:yes gene_type:complete